MRKSKRIISFVLSVLFVLSTLTCAAISIVGATAANGANIGGVNQTSVIADRDATYEALTYDFKGAFAKHTEMTVPGLSATDNYVPQGIAYWAEKNWVLISAYDAAGTKPSLIYALDFESGDYVACFALQKGGANLTDKVSGIGVSEHNLYLTTGGGNIGFISLTQFRVAAGTFKSVSVAGEMSFSTELNGANVGYLQVQDGILWLGNTYDSASSATYGHPSYKSAVCGYTIMGGTSADEWNMLKNANGRDKGYKGHPTYFVAANVEKIQSAFVSRNRLYMSTSSGSTAASAIYTAAVDIAAEGTTALTVGGAATNAYVVSTAGSYYDLPGSKGIVMINDMLYNVYESGANKNIGSALNPVDCVWELDIYSIQGLAAPEHYTDAQYYYTRVYTQSEITPDDEYIIVFESDMIAPNGKKYIYALDADGGYNGNTLPRLTSSEDGTPASTRHSLGIVGYPITDYTTQGDNLYLNEADQQNLSMQWNIQGDITGSNGVRITSVDPKFASTPYLYWDSYLTYMCAGTNSRFSRLRLKNVGTDGSGEFRLYFYDEQSDFEMWCNDGSNSTYMNSYNAYYQDRPDDDWVIDILGGSHEGRFYCGTLPESECVFSGCTEQAGTFHLDADAYNTRISKNSLLENGHVTKTGNKVGYTLGSKNASYGIQINRVGIVTQTYVKPVADKYTHFRIYKKCVDDSVVTGGKSNFITNKKVTLEADGTYSVELEAFATGEFQRTLRTTNKALDIVLILDQSGSMINHGTLGFTPYYRANGNGVCWNNVEDKELYYKYDGEYYRLKQKRGKTGDDFLDTHWYANLYFEKDGVKYFIVSDGSAVPYPNATYDDDKGYYTDSSKTTRIARYQLDWTSPGTKQYLAVDHYEAFIAKTRLTYAEEAMVNFIDAISADAVENNVTHRIAIGGFGSDGDMKENKAWEHTGMFVGGSWQGHKDLSAEDYEEVFLSAKNNTKLDAMAMQMTTDKAHTATHVGFEMAQASLQATGRDYSDDGAYKSVVILLTDGVPGTGSSDTESHATTYANKALAAANSLKTNCNASVYMVRVGTDSTNAFPEAKMTKFLEGCSSNCTGATNMDYNASTAKVDSQYVLTAEDQGSTEVLTRLFGDIIENAAYGSTTVQLDERAVVQDVLSDSFTLPEGYVLSDNIVTKKVPVSVNSSDEYVKDFAHATDVAVTPNLQDVNVDGIDTKKLTVTGFDYSENFVTAATPGNMLYVKITGLLPNDGVSGEVPVSLIDGSGIFEQEGDKKPVTYIDKETTTIPEYTYVFDFANQMVSSVLGADTTILAVDETPARQVNASGAISYKTTSNDGRGTTASISASKTTLDMLIGQGSRTSTHTKYVFLDKNGTYQWAKLNLVPASNILLEDHGFEYAFTAADGKTTVFSDNGWTKCGSSMYSTQSTSTNSDRYGYDANYNTSTPDKFSDGTYTKSTVTKANPVSNGAYFCYYGTGFDLLSACGKNTGIITLKIKHDGATRIIMVDTYLSDESIMTEGTDGLLLRQAPVFNYSDEFGFYEVEMIGTYLSSAGAVKAANSTGYGAKPVSKKAAVESALKALGITDVSASDVELRFMDANSIFNGGTGAQPATGTTEYGEGTAAKTTYGAGDVSLNCYIDAVRIYNPLNTNDYYYIEQEKDPEYTNVVENIMGKATGSLSGTECKFAYAEGESMDDVEFVDYRYNTSSEDTGAPYNEFYLKPQSGSSVSALSFKVNGFQKDKTSVMVSMRVVNGTAGTTIKVGDQSYSITSGTELYYDITDGVQDDGTVVIENIGSNLVSICNVKLVGLGSYSIDDNGIDPTKYSMKKVAKAAQVNAPRENDTAAQTSDSDFVIDTVVTVIDPTAGIFELLIKIFNLLQQLFTTVYGGVM